MGENNRGRSIQDLDPYTVFGYLLPGSALTICILSHYEKTSNWLINGIYKYPSPTLGITIAITLALLSYTIGHMLSSVSGLLFDHCLVNKCLGTPMSGKGEIKSLRSCNCFLKILRKTAKCTNYYASLSDKTKCKAEEIIKNEIGFEPNDSERYWFAFSSVANANGVGFHRIMNFVGLYGLARNLCLACLISSFFHPYYYVINGLSKLAWFFWALFAALIWLLNYFKLLKRCHTEVYTHFIVLNIANNTSKSESMQ